MKCKFCGSKLPDNAIFCPGCGTKVSAAYSDGMPKRATPPPKPAAPQSAVPDVSAAPAKKNNAGCLSVIVGTLVIVVIFIICWCITDTGTSRILRSSQQTSSEYQTSALYSEKAGLRLAVEIDDYDGSIMKAGTYTVYVDDADFLSGNEYPALWGIYVSDTYHEYIEDLPEENLVALVGGWNMNEDAFTVEPGQYIYCKLESTAGNPTGTLTMELTD